MKVCTVKEEVHEVYYPDEGRPLTDALFEAIEAARGEDIRDADFRLCDDVDPDALDRFFGSDAISHATVTFTTDSVQVELRGKGIVDIRVKPK